jgi:hypothetical protein
MVMFPLMGGARLLLPLQREATVLMAVILEAGNLQVSQSWSAQTLLPGLLPASYLCTLNTSIPDQQQNQNLCSGHAAKSWMYCIAQMLMLYTAQCPCRDACQTGYLLETSESICSELE